MKTIVFLILIFTIFQSKAIDLGSLDTSFSNDGVSDGWDRSGETGYYRYGSATVVDSQGRIYVAGTYDYDAGGSTAKGARIERYLPSGTLDNTFGTGGIKTFAVPPAPINQFEYSLVLGPSDSIFMGYSRLYCIVGNECHSNIKIYYVNSSGVTVGDITIPFDLGGTWERNDDNISDMVYMPTLNRLAISAEVERLGSLMKMSRRMSELIDKLLEFSRINRSEPHTEEIDLDEVLSGVLEMMDSSIKEHQATITYKKKLPKIAFDPSRCGEIFYNLILNGLKYNTSSPKEIEIGMLDSPNDSGQKIFYVKDNGIGIPEKHHDSVFKMFKRLHGRDAFGGGTGAGLTIIKRIINKHGGNIWIKSPSEGGTIFYFTLEEPIKTE